MGTGVMLMVLAAGLSALNGSLTVRLVISVPILLLALGFVLGGWRIGRSLRLVATDDIVAYLRGEEVLKQLPLSRMDRVSYRIEHRGSVRNRSQFHVFDFVDREARLSFTYAQQFASQTQVAAVLDFLDKQGVVVHAPF